MCQIQYSILFCYDYNLPGEPPDGRFRQELCSIVVRVEQVDGLIGRHVVSEWLLF